METPATLSRSAALLALLDQREAWLCRRFNAVIHQSGLRLLFQIASRLGDGVVWYGLIAAILFLGGERGPGVAARMSMAGIVGLLLYRRLKHTFVRERPFITHSSIRRAGVPLDRFSFPSGHTLHAVSFSIIAAAAYPALWVLLLPLVVLIALSRVVLGLHYLSDVMVGAAIGAGLANLTLVVLPL